MKAREIMDFMNGWAPESLAESWDNVGFQIGRDDLDVSGIVLALDLDERVFEFAREKNANMIISHHPFIFGGLNSITNETYLGSLIMKLIENNMVFYAAHTNLDQAQDGVNEELARIFDLKASRVLEVTSDEAGELGYGMIGSIERIRVRELIDRVKEGLAISSLTVYGDINREVESLALVGGSGSSFIELAAKEGADLLITGDIKYHDGQLAERLGLVLVDPGHFHTEKPVLDLMKRKLELSYPDLRLDIYRKPSPIYEIL